ncbi:MAG: bifunctional DNA-formamidopyrimidine glycosylase/DNA-(apurinic or apyrimidinic site) lyase [Acidobacteriaceae bacterium]|nr:bifunctional DNA-formamidopyrimidine glycosylase/DNA-(apurinic or apyrimidinic site) lyase [Acidobacteriaceae bacterium]MBV8572083.1 bifunctional DNA-formamidopyrimidine glycosylase/DNA-(apurinic or apyrimidinic site) lyase [Acidobacteriaceae bacterium]
MPELPEVETVVRSVAAHVTGAQITHAEVSSRRVTRGDHEKTARGLTGAIIEAVRRHGKQIFFELDSGLLYVHLGMTGKLLWNTEPGKYTRAELTLDRGVLLYDDVRQFGRFEYFREAPAFISTSGPDALSVSFEDFFSRLRERRGPIKPLLLNQRFIGGVGNIYADEALFSARIHPRAKAGRLSKQRAQELYGSILRTLKLAIEHRGSSISDYVDASGERGGYQLLHCVYGRAGEACCRCGAVIRRIVLGQRGTHYCPRCQRT